MAVSEWFVCPTCGANIQRRKRPGRHANPRCAGSATKAHPSTMTDKVPESACGCGG